MIAYAYVLYDRVNEQYLRDKQQWGPRRFSKDLALAKKYTTEGRANAIKNRLKNPQNYSTLKISISLDIDINPTSQEYALWMGGKHVESYIAYRNRTGLGVYDIMDIFKTVYALDDFSISSMLNLIKSTGTP